MLLQKITTQGLRPKTGFWSQSPGGLSRFCSQGMAGSQKVSAKAFDIRFRDVHNLDSSLLTQRDAERNKVPTDVQTARWVVVLADCSLTISSR